MGKKRRDGRASKRGNNSASNADARNSGGDGLQHTAATETIRYRGGIYEGELKDDKPHGRGRMVWEDGAFYDGEWKEGVQHGMGEMKWMNGDIYDGEWEDDMKHGRGTYRWKDGRVYEGEYQDGMPHGNGTAKYASGGVHEGEWAKGKPHGKGTVTLPTGEIYEGIWVKGKLVSAESTNHVPPPDNAITALKANCELLDGRKMRSIRSQERRVEADTKTCEHCGVDDYRYKLRVCSGCNLALYCSDACQKAASRSHRRICDIVSTLPSRDSDRLILEYDRDILVDLDAGLRYATKYMDNIKHLQINLEQLSKGDVAPKKFTSEKLCSLLKSKKGKLDSVFWLSYDYFGFHGHGHDDAVWRELNGLKQLRLEFVRFDGVQPLHDLICRQRYTLMVLCLSHLEIDWHKAKSRRTIAEAVNTCKHLVKLCLEGCVPMDFDLKLMLHSPNLRILQFTRSSSHKHEFTDNTCGLIARKCPGLQELNLYNHNQLSARGIRKIFEGCPHLRSFCTSTLKLSGKDICSLLDVAPQLMCLSLRKDIGVTAKEVYDIIEKSGGRTVIWLGFGIDAGRYELIGERIPSELKEKYGSQKDLLAGIFCNKRDPENANEWAGMFEG